MLMNSSRKGFIVILVVTATSCSLMPTSSTSANGKQADISTSTFKGCSDRPVRPRRFYHHPGDEWAVLNPIDNLMSPEANYETGETPFPDYDAAWKEVEYLLENCPKCTATLWWQIYHRAAVIRYNLGDHAGAIPFFKKMLDQSPYIPEGLETQVTYHIAQMLTVEGDYAGALYYYDKWESFCPLKIPESYFQDRAMLHLKLGNNEKASYYQLLDAEH